jgi:hypothetical protein
MTDLVTAFATVGLLAVGWYQLKKFNKTTRADFAHRLNKDLLGGDLATLKRIHEILKCLDSGQVIFKKEKDRTAYFYLMGSDVSCFSSYELNDLILGPLENVASFEKRKAIDVSLAYDVSSSYLFKILRYEVVKEYIDWLREEDLDIYVGLTEMHEKFKEHYDFKEKIDEWKGSFENFK